MSKEEELLTALHAAHAGAVRGFVGRYVRDEQLAQDAVQETFLRAWRRIDRLDTRRGTTRSYLFSIARNVVTDAWRAEQRRPRLVADELAIAGAPSEEDVDAAVDGWLVSAALEQLSANHLEVIRSLYFEGRTVAEVAEETGLPIGTVKSRSFYAVRALRAAFEEMGVLR